MQSKRKATQVDRALTLCGLGLNPARETPALKYASVITCLIRSAKKNRELSLNLPSLRKARELREDLKEEVCLRYTRRARTGQRKRSRHHHIENGMGLN